MKNILLCLSLWVSVSIMGQNMSVDQRVEELLDKMTLEEKVYQLCAFMGHRTKRILRIERKEYQTY